MRSSEKTLKAAFYGLIPRRMLCYFGIFKKNKVTRETSLPPTIHECTAWKCITWPSGQNTKSFNKSEHFEVRDMSIGCTRIELVDVCDISIGWTHEKPYGKGTRSVTWKEHVDVFDIPMRQTHIKPQRQSTRSVTWNENVQVFYIPIRTTHVEPQGASRHQVRHVGYVHQ